MPGGMPGGMHMRTGPGMHFYTNFGGPGGMRAQRQRAQQGRGRQEQPQGFASLLQFLPFFLIMIMSFFNMSSNDGSAGMSSGENRYFSLTVGRENARFELLLM